MIIREIEHDRLLENLKTALKEYVDYAEYIKRANDASGSDESGADAFTPLRRTAGNLRICAGARPNYSASTAEIEAWVKDYECMMIGFASEIEAWVQDHERRIVR